MNKRERKYLEIHERHKNDDLTGLLMSEIIQKGKMQNYLYTEAWRRFDIYVLKQNRYTSHP